MKFLHPLEVLLVVSLDSLKMLLGVCQIPKVMHFWRIRHECGNILDSSSNIACDQWLFFLSYLCYIQIVHKFIGNLWECYFFLVNRLVKFLSLWFPRMQTDMYMTTPVPCLWGCGPHGSGGAVLLIFSSLLPLMQLM